MGRVLMMSVMSSTPSPAVSAFKWAHTHLFDIFYDFLMLLEAHDFPRGTILHLILYFYLYCAMGTH